MLYARRHRAVARAFAARALVALAFAATLVVVDGAVGCAGCSAECSGLNQGNETCPCSSDQDCTTRLGTVLLCVEGACKEGDPPDAEGKACDADADCGSGFGCGVDGVCVNAPTCQRVDGPLRFANAGGSGDVFPASRDDCSHTWTVNGVEATFTIDLDGVITFVGDSGCFDGGWHAGDRLGFMTCGGQEFAITPPDLVVCFNADVCAEGTTCDIVDQGIGVCR